MKSLGKELSNRQKAVIEYLQDCPKGITSLESISEALGCPCDAVMKETQFLHERGLISEPQKIQSGDFNGMQIFVLT